jgi:hypothetical protein
MADDETPPLTRFSRLVVAQTNRVLASTEKQMNAISQPISKALHQGSDMTHSLERLYQHRHMYAPYIVGGSSVAAAGIMTLRRGRFMGLTAGLLTGGFTYGIVYDAFPIDEVFDTLSRKARGE